MFVQKILTYLYASVLKGVLKFHPILSPLTCYPETETLPHNKLYIPCLNAMAGNLFRFFLGILFAPTIILLHECGHYAAATAFGFNPKLHSSEISLQTTKREINHGEFMVITAAGPAVEAVLALGGIYWLWQLRHKRKLAPVTSIDWLPTFFAICAGRWLRCFTGTPASPQPGDEAKLSGNFGLPHWFLPYFLAPFALLILVTAIRLHPPGSRLIPFASVILGGCLGGFLWLHWLGPRILP